jgi:hypothetical protein
MQFFSWQPMPEALTSWQLMDNGQRKKIASGETTPSTLRWTLRTRRRLF